MTLTPATAAAIWSAVAASFAALASLLIVLIQRRNLLDSVRPELVLTGWNRAARKIGDAVHEVVTFEAIKNVGRGAALNIHLNTIMRGNRPTAASSTKRPSILAASEASDLKGEVFLWWENVQPEELGHKCLPFVIQIYYWDSRGIRHETKYSLIVAELNGSVTFTDEIAPGVMLATRTTVSKPVWSLRLRAKLGRIPGLRWLAEKSAW